MYKTLILNLVFQNTTPRKSDWDAFYESMHVRCPLYKVLEVIAHDLQLKERLEHGM